MKKIFNYLCLMFGFVLGMMAFTACGGEDDDDDIGGIQQPTKEWRVCATCSGTGKHTECNGTGRCPRCNGKGKYTEVCSPCLGLGYEGYGVFKITCHTCNGTGSVTYSCSECASTGKCSACTGTGKCIICKGEGGYSVKTSSYGGGGSGGSYDDDDNDDVTAGWSVSALVITYSTWSNSFYTSTTTLWLQPDNLGRIYVYSSSSKSNNYGPRKNNTDSSYGGYDVSGYSYYATGDDCVYYFN